MQVVEEKVKPQRSKDKRDIRRKYWWRFGETTPALFATIDNLKTICVSAQTSKYRAFTFLPAGMIYDQKLIVFAFTNFHAFSAMHSQTHENWARFLGSSMKDDPVYTLSDCFETFPFPENFETDERLETIGKTYYDRRTKLMVKNGEGLTKSYNRFHHANETAPEIKKLRKLHEVMDRAVLDVYGWTDLRPTCEFLLDYEDDEDEESRSSRRKKPWRYRWPDNFRDEVLARLLELNTQRAKQEGLAGLTAESATGKYKGRKKKISRATSRRHQQELNAKQPSLLDI